MNQRTIRVPSARLARWIEGFGERHGGGAAYLDGALTLEGADGARARLTPLFPMSLDGECTVEAFVEQVSRPPRCAAILVRRGGFATAVVDDGEVTSGHAGRRHVQARTAAGGWSQQRFARRREKQADELVAAVVDYAVRLIIPALPVVAVVTGGDLPLIDSVLADPRLAALRGLPRGPHLAIGNPDRTLLGELPELLTRVRIDLSD